ncbi:hypothetical protein CYMTET_14764 [Cymbomonas tetramitiformis]|uniref:Uncharacterized protein n=1 Tax=Cymbomonas tetramitiformis TaxID=36881 RepID=A0AAE0GGW6_9CHLO|nr:hypothetical protein CYMTET_14764 [Cymbomonas tetramitiformis]
MQSIQYKVLEALRVNEKWKGGTLSKAVIDYLNCMYRYIITSVVAAKEDLEWALPEEKNSVATNSGLQIWSTRSESDHAYVGWLLVCMHRVFIYHVLYV